jgi:hypothetical protein
MLFNAVEEKWKDFLRTEGARQLNLSMNGRVKKMADVAHTICWIGDIVFLYIEKKCKKPQINFEVKFP